MEGKNLWNRGLKLEFKIHEAQYNLQNCVCVSMCAWAMCVHASRKGSIVIRLSKGSMIPKRSQV